MYNYVKQVVKEKWKNLEIFSDKKKDASTFLICDVTQDEFFKQMHPAPHSITIFLISVNDKKKKQNYMYCSAHPCGIFHVMKEYPLTKQYNLDGRVYQNDKITISPGDDCVYGVVDFQKGVFLEKIFRGTDMVMVYEKMEKKCNVCGKISTKHCTACKYTYYCSPECQKSDWRKHKCVTLV